MKLDNNTKQIIDRYFDSISSEDLLKLLTERYHLQVDDAFVGEYDTFFNVADNKQFDYVNTWEYSDTESSHYESEDSSAIFVAA